MGGRGVDRPVALPTPELSDFSCEVPREVFSTRCQRQISAKLSEFFQRLGETVQTANLLPGGKELLRNCFRCCCCS